MPRPTPIGCLISLLVVAVSALATYFFLPDPEPQTTVLAQVTAVVVTPTLPITPTPAPPTATSTPRPPTATPMPPTATPVPPTPTPFGGGRPVSISIPAIGVENARLIDVGLDPDGAMETPKGWWDIGWYKFGPIPGESGASVVSGHYDSDSGPAVFWNLHRLKPGDRIVVENGDGATHSFIVESREVYPFNRAPLHRIFAFDDPVRRLNLITCNGVFDGGARNYDRRLVVYAVAEE